MAANNKNKKKETLAAIDSALTILNRFPNLEDSNVSLSYNETTNPFPFLMDIFKSVIGYDKLIQIIAKFVTFELPAVEAGVKAVLISKLKDTISCSVNPFLTDDILKNGITFNINEIDIVDTLKYSPFDKEIGYLYYFQYDEGLDYVQKWGDITTKIDYDSEWNTPETPDDCLKSDDMDCLLWYMVNLANKRYVWKPKKSRYGEEYREDYPNDETTKLKKEDGIVTFEFSERSNNVRDAYGANYNIQTPFNNILHVFIGDVREKRNDTTMTKMHNIEMQLWENDKEIKEKYLDLEKLENTLLNYEEKSTQIENDYVNQKYQNQEIEGQTVTAKEQFERDINEINKKINDVLISIKNTKEVIDERFNEKNKNQHELAEIKLEKNQSAFFPFNAEHNRNYYYGKTLIEFNIDYITSLTLFDSKSLVAKLIDSLTGVLTIDLHLSYKQQLIKNEVTKMVKMVTNSDDIVVSDCFFTFSNDDYDEMYRKAELRKAGLLTINGDETSAVKIDAASILSSLNELNKTASQEKMQTVIEGTLTELSKQLSNTEYSIDSNVNFGVQMTFIENLLDSLAYTLVMCVLSPKVYLLLLINLKIIGRETNFNLEGFIGQYKQMIADLIRSIRDQLLIYLQNELMKIIGDLVNQIALKLGIEQARYYTKLIKRLIECYEKKRKSGDFDFSIDDVNYADILEDEQEPKNSEC